MSQAGWNKTDQPGCMSGSDAQGLGGGGFCIFGKDDGNKQSVRFIATAQEEGKNDTQVFYVRFDGEFKISNRRSSWPSNWDILIGAGCVKRVEAAYVADEAFGTIGPRWRQAIQRGPIEWEDYSNFAMVSRFTAGAMGLPFMPTRSLLGSDVLAKDSLSPEQRTADPRRPPRRRTSWRRPSTLTTRWCCSPLSIPTSPYYTCKRPRPAGSFELKDRPSPISSRRSAPAC